METIFDIELDDVTDGSGFLCNVESKPAGDVGSSQGVWLRDVQRLQRPSCSQSAANRHSDSGVSRTAAVAGTTGNPWSASLQLQVMRALANLPDRTSPHQMAAALHRAGLDVRLVAALGPRGPHGVGPGNRGGADPAGGAQHGPLPLPLPLPLPGPPCRAPEESRWAVRDPYLLVLPRRPKPAAVADFPTPVTGCLGGCDGATHGAAGSGVAEGDGGDVRSVAPLMGASPLHRRHRSDLTAARVRAADAAGLGGCTEAAAAAVGGATAAVAAASSVPEADAAEPLLIEPGLRDLFRVGRSTPHYDQLVGRLPQLWVGPRAALLDVAATMCLVMEVNFRSQCLDVPPWRTHAAVLSRWDERLGCELPLELDPARVGQLPEYGSTRGMGAPTGQSVRQSPVSVEALRADAGSRSSALAAPAIAGGGGGGGGGWWSRQHRETLNGEPLADLPAAYGAAAIRSSSSSYSSGPMFSSSVTFITCCSSGSSSYSSSSPTGYCPPSGLARVCGQDAATRAGSPRPSALGTASARGGLSNVRVTPPDRNSMRRCSASGGSSSTSSSSSSSGDTLSESVVNDDDEEAQAQADVEEELLLGTAGASPHSVLLLLSGSGFSSRTPGGARAGASGGVGGGGGTDSSMGNAVIKLSVSEAVVRRERGYTSPYMRPAGQLHSDQGRACEGAGTGVVAAGALHEDPEPCKRHSEGPRAHVVVYGFQVPPVPALVPQQVPY